MDKLIKLQIALFFFEIETRPDRLISVVNDNLGNLFDAMPSIFPIPQEAPPEIPIVTLSDSNQRFSCSIARSRIDFSRVISAGEQLDETDKVITDFQKKANLFVAAVSQAKKVVRFGFIAQYFFRDKNPTLQITRKYLKPDLGPLEEITLRYNKKKDQFGYSLNDIYEITAANEMDGGELRDGVFVQRDLNNAIASESLTKENILSIIDKNMQSFQVEKTKELVK